MAHFFRLICALFALAFCGYANAAACSYTANTVAGYDVACQGNVYGPCTASPQTYVCSAGSCDYGGVAVPACVRNKIQVVQTYSVGFTGTCPAAGSQGPSYSGEFGSAGPPETSCSGPCRVQNTGVSVCIPRSDGSQYCTGETQHTGEACVPTPSEPPVSTPPDDCPTANQINGKCLTVEDTDQNPTSPPVTPSVCIGTTCNEIPPNPAASADCVSNPQAAVCVGHANGTGSPPRPPSPPYPPSQTPAHATTAQTSAGPVRVDVYGPANTQSAGPPDGSGQCPAGTTLTGGLCSCPSAQVWNGTACAAEGSSACPESDPNYPNCEGGERTATEGNCGPGGEPSCAGDEIDCSIVKQTWATRCALLGDGTAPGVDLDSDPLAQYGGEEALFTDDEAIGPGSLNSSGWIGGGSCPTIPPIQVLSMSLTIPSVWCELSWLGSLLVSIAYLVALRIVYGE